MSQTAATQSLRTASTEQVDIEMAYPSSRGAARMIGISASTLGRRKDLERLPAGQEARLSPTNVIRLTALYRRRSTSLVAGELVTHAARMGPDVERAVLAEVEAALEHYAPRRPAPSDAESFLADARRLLPAALARQVERVMRRGDSGSLQGGGEGWTPDDD